MNNLATSWLVELLAHPAARLLTLALLHFLWQGLAVALVLVAAVELLGIRRVTTRYACSLAALLVMLACPLATLAWLSLPSESPLASAESTVAYSVADSVVGTARPTWLALLQPLALAAWLAGVSAFGGRLLIGAIGLSRLRRSRQPLPLDLASLVEKLGRRMKIEALPLVFISRRVSEAMAVGLFRPLVLIPAAWVTEMPLPLLEAVIAHELAHLRRRDLWVNLLQRVAETLLFYHPAIWWLSRRLRTERELCADELAVAATGRRLEYAQALEQVAHRRQAEVRPALAAFMRGETNMRVLERVRNVLGLAGGEKSRLWPAGIVALALPAALWAAAVGLRSATAQEKEKEVAKQVEARFFGKDGEKKDEPRRDGDVKKEGARDGEVKKDGPRDGEVKKDGPRDGEVRKVVARDGDAKKDVARDGEARKDVIRKEPARDGEPRKDVVRKEPARDGEPRKDAVRKEPARDGEPRKEAVLERKIVREGDRPAGEGARIEELTNLVKRLSAQVEKLQAEVAELRGGKGEGSEKEAVLRRLKAEGAEKEGAARASVKEALIKEANARRAGEEKEAAVKRAAAEKEEAVRRREGGDKPRAEGDKPRAEGDKPRPEGAARADVIRKIEVIKERANEEKEAAAKRDRELIEKKKAEAAAVKEEKKDVKKEHR